MRIEDFNWMDVEKYLKNEDRIMLVLGQTEQHGYLSLATDSRIPQAIADAASQRSGVLVAPVLNFGISPYFLSYPGTTSIRVSVYVEFIKDIVRSYYGQGFQRFLIVNGHGGNTPATGALYELANELRGARFDWFSWWTTESTKRIAAEHNLPTEHANWMEAFQFTKVAELPSEGKPVLEGKGIRDSQTEREFYGDGTFGGPYQADDSVMESILAEAVNDVLEALKFE
jgi:creatinine amidohydrolase